MQVVYFADYVEDPAHVDRKQQPQRNLTIAKVADCSIQPAGPSETVGATSDYSQIEWHCLAPAVPAAATISAKGFLFYDDFDAELGVHTLGGKARRETITDPETNQPVDCAQFQVLGSDLFTDVNTGALDHVTVHAKTEVG